MMPERGLENSITLVAILKGEEPFINEWIAYHRIIGIDHFLLYDNDPRGPLSKILLGHNDYVTVVPWSEDYSDVPGRNIQTKAYTDALLRVKSRWVTFLDGDEFIVLRKHGNLKMFLDDFAQKDVIRLWWHMFGHNGFYSNPPGLITASLTKRRALPGRQFKSITKTDLILSINSAHECCLKNGAGSTITNAMGNEPPREILDPEIAGVNHYFCRSFENWMARISRGDTAHDASNYPRDDNHRWRFEPDRCLRKFVEEVALWNEVSDDFMLRYKSKITDYIQRTRMKAGFAEHACQAPGFCDPASFS